MVESACDIFDKPRALPKLCATTFANSASCLAKDAAFARAYGGAGPAVPRTTLFFFLLRDVVTMGCAFVLPMPLARLTGGSPRAAQFACPVACQVLFLFFLSTF